MSLIYIVEDDESIREIECIALTNSGHEVRSFPNAKLFYSELEKLLPELIVLDIMLPDEDGNAILKKLRSNDDTRSIPVIMVTAKTTDMDLVRSIEGGADDYLKKPFSLIELIARVKALLRRSIPAKSSVLYLDEMELDVTRRKCTLSGQNIELTYKEFELLYYLLLNKGIVLSRDKIMQNVWESSFQGETRTVDMHIKTLRHKLGVYAERLKTVRNVGYVIE